MVENALPDDPAPSILLTTPLDAWHRAHGARMVPFAGYAMPVQYDLTGALAQRCRGGVLAEHLHCRAQAALFDVSHMGQATLTGPTAAAALETLVPGDIAGLKPGRQRYTLLTNEAGGILDDLMVATLEPGKFFLVVNASRKADDFAHIAAALPAGVSLAPHPERALLALQGPLAAAVLARLCPAAAALPFMGVASALVRGIPCLLSRSGYTGEDGFEISVPAERAVDLAHAAGRAARGRPRRPRRARLAAAGSRALPVWQRHRRTDHAGRGRTDLGDRQAPQAERGISRAARRSAINSTTGAPRLRVGIRPDGRAPARAGTTIAAEDGTEAGIITSGGFGPSLNAPIAMGYVRRDLAADGTKLSLLVRGKALPATVAPLPFVPHRYAR